MASCARSGSWAAMASAISRWISMVSSSSVPLVVSTNRGIELLITGTSLGTTTFLLLKAMAAIAAIGGSRRKRTSRRSLISFCLLPIKVKPSGSSTIPGEDEIYVPEPCRIVTIFRDARSFMASRTELLPAFRRSERMVSFGNLSPG